MRLALWCVGVFQVLGGLMVCRGLAPAWCWLWGAAGVLWFFVGCGLLVSWLVHLVKSRLGGVKLSELGKGKGSTPPPREER